MTKQRELEHLEIIVEGDLVRACANCMKESEVYAEDVHVLADGFKRSITHGCCKEHFNRQMEELDNLDKDE